MWSEIDAVNAPRALEARNTIIQGLVNATFRLGALVGALSCSVIDDILGHRKAIILGGCLAGIGQVLQCTAFSLAQLIVGRFILGLGVGQVNAIVPVWVSECSSTSKRGRQVITCGIFIYVGFTLTSWINVACSQFSFPPLQWRIHLAIPAVCSLIIVCSIFSLPEFPRWLVQNQRSFEAAESLAQLNCLDSANEYVHGEISRIGSALEMSNSNGLTLREIFTGKDEDRLALRFGLCMAIQSFQQLVGGNVVSSLTTSIFEDNLHRIGKIPAIVAAGALTWKFICSFIAYGTVDSLEQQRIFIISGSGMSMCMIAMAISNSFPSSNQYASVAGAVFIFLFNSFYPISFLRGNFLYCTEIAPPQLRANIASIATENHWTWNFIFVMITPVALSTFGLKFYIVFASTCACIPVFVFLSFPKTVNRDLEQID